MAGMGRPRAALLATMCFAAPLSVSLAGCNAPSNTSAGGAGATSATHGAATTTKSSTTVATVNGSSSSGAPFVCDPPAAPGSLYEKDALQQFEFEPTSMCQFRGDVLLIVNTAAV